MTLLHKGRTINLPATWGRMGFVDKAGYLSAQGMSYPEACSLLRGRRSPKPKSPPPEVVYAELERRNLA